MIIQGQYNTAKIFTENVDPTCLSQIKSFLDSPLSENSNIRVMPDCHAGKGCVIGFTMTITDKVCPNLVGVDIGCGMLTLELDKKISPKDFVKLCKHVPSGFKQVHSTPKFNFDYSKFKYQIGHLDHIKCSLGTLGSGNHFIELNENENKKQYVVIHTGSRSLGLQIAAYYQNIAFEKAGNQNPLSWLEGEDMENYLHDMKLAQEYAIANRANIRNILEKKGLSISNSFETVHNYISFEDYILRKGAISAKLGEKVLIPLNMKDGSLLCEGLGNPDWNFSGPHGAGRRLSRSQANDTIKLEDFIKSMKGIYSETVCVKTIDESPFCYKRPKDIINSISGESVVIKEKLKVLANFKGV